MIQFNLLPDVKLEYIKTARTKRMVIFAAIGVTVVALAIFIGLFLLVNVAQRKHLNDLNRDIARDIAKLEQVPDLDKVLTVQNQLSRLTELHNSKPVTSRLSNYLVQLTPTNATIAQVTLDFDNNTMTIRGNADSLNTVNKYVDTIKFTEYKDGDTTEKAFSDVVLTSFSLSSEQTGARSATYQIDFKFDPIIFDGTKEVTLEVPGIISTRSVTEKPSDLFQGFENNGNSQ